MPFNATTDLPWNAALWSWQPFRIDALGLVTLLGAEEINSTLGRLVPSTYLEYLPLLGAFVIAGERFKEKRPSFNLYNFTDGISTTDFSFWLARWMAEQEFETTRSVVHFEVPDKPRSFLKMHIVSGLLSFCLTGFLVAMTVLIGDWYGFANAIAMILSVLTRAYSMQVHRNAIDEAVNAAAQKQGHHEVKKCVVIMSDAKAVTIFLPANLIVPVFVHNPEPLHPWLYHMIRYIGWAVFGVHIVTIGMATLLPQIYTVFLIVVSTVLTCWKLGCDDSKWKVKFDRRILNRKPRDVEYECWIGSRLKAYISEWPVDAEFEFKKEKDPRESHWIRRPKDAVLAPSERSRKRMDLYAWLNLTSAEEESLGKWDLLPHMRNGNESWWETYNAKKALISQSPLSNTRRKAENVVVQTRSVPGAGDGDDDSDNITQAPPSPSGIISPPARANTWITSSGFVAPNPTNQTASAFVRAGMTAIGLPIDSTDIPMQTLTNRRTNTG